MDVAEADEMAGALWQTLSIADIPGIRNRQGVAAAHAAARYIYVGGWVGVFLQECVYAECTVCAITVIIKCIYMLLTHVGAPLGQSTRHGHHHDHPSSSIKTNSQFITGMPLHKQLGPLTLHYKSKS